MEETTREEVTTVENPQQVVRKTTKQVEPQAKGEAPQKVYEKKKTIFRFIQVIWYITGLIEVLILFRIVLKALGANSSIGFTNFIYAITAPFADPFRGILVVTTSGGSLIEWTSMIAGVVYLCVAWGLVYLLDMIYPITPKDVETQ